MINVIKNTRDGFNIKYACVLVIIFTLFVSCSKTGMPYDFIYAARDGDFEFVKECVENKKVDINAVNDNGNTALHMAAFNNRPEMVKYLLEHGADPSLRNKDGVFSGDTPLDQARGDEVKQLLRDAISKTQKNYTTDSKWKSASGNMWSNVKLYYGPQKAYVGEIICFDKNHILPDGTRINGIKIKSYSGSYEWKTREAVREWYVKKDDPAINTMMYYECK